MLPGILDRAMLISPLKQSLDISAQRTKVIAGRVAQASMSAADGFTVPTAGTPGGAPAEDGAPVDLEQEMVSLADEQLHFEAAAKLLEKAYAQLRLAIKDK
jgi:flagellar basal body rod protein FlgB